MAFETHHPAILNGIADSDNDRQWMESLDERLAGEFAVGELGFHPLNVKPILLPWGNSHLII